MKTTWLLLLLSTSAWAAEPSYAYDKKALPGLEQLSEAKRDGLTVKEVRFKSPSRSEPVTATLVVPAGTGPFAGALYVHWLGDAKTTNRTEFLEEALGLGKRGAVCLLVDAMWSRPGWFGKLRKPETDLADAAAQVKELQRAMDLLLAQPGVDAARVGFVGHDFGAMYGVLMGSAEPRAKTYVLLAPTATFSEWFLLGRKPADVPAFVKQLEPLDLPPHLPKLNASVLLQFAKVDGYVSPEKVKVLSEAAVEPKLVRVYDSADHSMTSRDGLNERYRWLAKELSLTPP